jgi:glutamate formiminotransferase/formiminotetrahydrofolate cyclodeaminase
MKIVECVPNFSEGRNKKVIEEIVEAIKSVENIEVLDVYSGYETNRTVITFIGPPENIKEAAFLGIKKGIELIDMRKHKGAHPRIGAVDVVPFVPLKNVSYEECIEIANEVAKKVGDELKIPVYLYGKAAKLPERKELSKIREGEYEGLPLKLKDERWKPDYGPCEFNPKAGAIVIGVRDILIAYNINLNTREVKYANDIAFEIREKGRSARKGDIKPFYYRGEIIRYREGEFPCGNCEFVGKNFEEILKHCKEKHGYDLIELLKMHDIEIDDIIGKPVKKPGKFKECKAIGWKIPEYDRVQVSINLTNYRVTPLHIVYEEVKKLAEERGISVTGSEIVGLVPYDALCEAGKYYLRKQNKSFGIPSKDILETAIQSLGLRDVGEFEIEKKVILLPEIFTSKFLNQKLTEFVDEISRETPSPGGGSVSALASSLAFALSSMVLNLSFDKIKNKKVLEKAYEISDRLRELKEETLLLVQKDKEAFENYLKALREKKNLENALREAINVPFTLMEKSLEGIKFIDFILKYGLKSALSDIGCSILNFYSSFYGAYMNVLINLKNFPEKEEILEKAKKMEKEFNKIFKKYIKKIFKNLFQ